MEIKKSGQNSFIAQGLMRAFNESIFNVPTNKGAFKFNVLTPEELNDESMKAIESVQKKDVVSSSDLLICIDFQNQAPAQTNEDLVLEDDVQTDTDEDTEDVNQEEEPVQTSAEETPEPQPQQTEPQDNGNETDDQNNDQQQNDQTQDNPPQDDNQQQGQAQQQTNPEMVTSIQDAVGRYFSVQDSSGIDVIQTSFGTFIPVKLI